MRNNKAILLCVSCICLLGTTLFASGRIFHFGSTDLSRGEQQPATTVDHSDHSTGRRAGLRHSEADSGVAAQDQTRRRIQGLREARDMNGLVALADELDRQQAQFDAAQYADLMLEVSSSLASYDFKDDRQYSFAPKYAASALKNADSIPLETEIRLVLYVQGDLTALHDTSTEEWSRERSNRARYWFHAWQRLEAEIDRGFDFNQRPLLHVMPPAGANPHIPGISPAAIKDPKLRAEYEAAIAANNQKIENYNKQHQLKQLEQLFTTRAEAYIVSLYSTPPANTDELRQYLNTYLLDQQVRERMLSQASANILEPK